MAVAAVLGFALLASTAPATAADYSPTITGQVIVKSLPGKKFKASATSSLPCTSWSAQAVGFAGSAVKSAGSGTSARVSFKHPKNPGKYAILFTCTYGGGKTIQTRVAFTRE
jgi:hypothetical protein